MFAQRRTIAAPIMFVSADTSNAQNHTTVNLRNSLDSLPQKRDHVAPHNNSFAEFTVPVVSAKEYGASTVTAPIVASAVGLNSIQTYDIAHAFSQLKGNIIARGNTYANNTLATRRGYIAENFVADTYNLDATIKKVSDRATVPESTQDASPDILYDGKQASLKFYQDAESSAKAQTNPKYGEQTRIIPSDQVDDGKAKLNELAKKNDTKGRTESADSQRDTAERLEATIKGSEGAESTPLSKKDADDLAKAFKTDESGNKTVDETSIDRTLEKTGVTKKVKQAKMMNELRGIGIAAAIGLGTGFAIGLVVSLAQNGLNPNSLKYAFIAGAKQGGCSAVMAAGGAAIGVAARKATESLTEIVLTGIGANAAEETAKNIATMCNMGVVGSLTIVAFSVYEFARFKQNGYSTKECLLRTGKSAALSFSILIVSIVAQGIWGGCSGLVVSVTAGIIMTGYIITKIQHDKKVTREITYYSIELCRPAFQTT